MRLTQAVTLYGVWRLSRGAASVNTWRGEQPGLAHFAVSMGDCHVNEVTDEEAGDWWDALDLADSTKGTRLSQLRAFLRYCKQRGWLDHDPTQLLRAPSVSPEPRERLNAVELLSLLDVAHTPRDRALLALAMNLGLRGGEIQRLRWADVNWADETVRVHVDKTNEVDDMPMTWELGRELGRWSAERYRDWVPTEQSYVICSQHIAPSGTVTYRWGRQVAEPFEVVKRALTDIGWASVTQEGVHTVRRSVARLYFDKAEADESFDSALLATMTLLHHSRPETTLAYIGRDRATLARDRIMKGQPFLTAMRTPTVRLRAADDIVGVTA